MGKIFYLMGKSASGKDHIYEALLKDEELGLKPLVLYTTRPIRCGEVEGETYFFTDEQHLTELRAEGKIIEERCYQTVQGPWYYFTADEGQFETEKDIISIGTLESYAMMRKYFGAERLIPLYIEVEDGLRLKRAILREEHQKEPKYQEMCRRFLADSEDFSEEKLEEQGIVQRILNESTLEDCILRVKQVILKEKAVFKEQNVV